MRKFFEICLLSTLANCPVCWGADSESAAPRPYPDSSIIDCFVLDWATRKRFAQGSDNFQLTWAQDDHLYGAWNNNVFFAAFATKWLDGERFVLNFTGGGNGKDKDSFNTVEGRFVRAGEN